MPITQYLNKVGYVQYKLSYLSKNLIYQVNTFSRVGNPEPTFNCVFEYQPIASEILIQPSRYKWAESNLIADEKGPCTYLDCISILIHLLDRKMVVCERLVRQKTLIIWTSFIDLYFALFIHFSSINTYNWPHPLSYWSLRKKLFYYVSIFFLFVILIKLLNHIKFLIPREWYFIWKKLFCY